MHEPDSSELGPDIALEDLFEQGRQVGELAREYVPGGVLIDLPYRDIDGRVRATAEALAASAPVVYEAAFIAQPREVSRERCQNLRQGQANLAKTGIKTARSVQSSESN